MEEKKDRHTGAIIVGVVLTLVILVGIIAATSGAKSKYMTYRDEAITVLEKYKDGKYDEDEAAERLQDLYGDILSGKINATSEIEKDKFEFLNSEINAIKRSLRKGAVRDTDIDSAIRSLKNGR